MKKGLTKLEIILVGIILFFIVGFVVSKNLSLFVGKENLLRQRYNKYVSLLDNKNYSEAYKFFSSSVKSQGSLEDYIKSTKEYPNVGKQTVTINNIVVQDNNGYIDRINTTCEDDNCSSKKVLEGYKKWVFENENWYFAGGTDPLCIREKMYDMPPEFSRALSLFDQRFSAKYKVSDSLIFNCLDIQYSPLTDAEGVFTFDENKSSLDRLTIYVDNSYVYKDDILTAFLLSHEVNHAINYVTGVTTGVKKPCYDLEVAAFETQLMFLGSLNDEEQNSIIGRIVSMGYSNNNPLAMAKMLIDLSGKARYSCGSSSPDCYSKKMHELITNMVKNNPYYQKQCGQN